MVWQEKLLPGSKGKPWEWGLVEKSAGWVKGECDEVWSDKQSCWQGQRESRGSVAWKEKPPPGSKGKPKECGLEGKNAARSKKLRP